MLPDGLVLRTACPADLDQIGALLADRGDPADAIDLKLVVEDPDAGWSSCAVVVDGDRVVSTATLLDETLVLDGTPIPTGQVELVATDRAYEGRGLVRALMAWAHERSAARGHLAQVMLGIPYFYRQFGYAYAMPINPTLPLVTPPPEVPGSAPDSGGGPHEVRRATAADIPAMARLQAGAQAGAGLRMTHSDACWRWLVARDGTSEWIVERAGVPVATGRTTPPDEGTVLGEIAAVDEAAVYALVRGTAAESIVTRPGTFVDALTTYLGDDQAHLDEYYARVPDVVALLEHLRPVLGARLRASEYAGDEGEAVVSFFRSHVRIPYAHGDVGPIRPGGTMQAPGVAGGAGVAPDRVAPLLFGPHGLSGLSRLEADVYPGPNSGLMYTLFPPVRSDLLTFYLP